MRVEIGIQECLDGFAFFVGVAVLITKTALPKKLSIKFRWSFIQIEIYRTK
jgi:hypothetical protein